MLFGQISGNTEVCFIVIRILISHQNFDSIDHEILKGMLKDIPDRNVLGLLYHIIRSYEGATDSESGRKKGLPLGNQTSQWFALYYLDSMDRLIKEKMRIKYYVRYMDDGVLVHESKEYLKIKPRRLKHEKKNETVDWHPAHSCDGAGTDAGDESDGVCK